MILRRVLLVALCTPMVGLSAMSAQLVYTRCQIARRDARFEQVDIGQRLADVLGVMGEPDSFVVAEKAASREYGIDRFCIYRIERIGPPIKWEIGISANGTVVSKHHDGC
jgi:hypothetical protein